jgi:hypothetical protein
MKTLEPKRTVENGPSHDELMDVAWDVARRFIDFGSYGSKANARKALQRRCKGFTKEEYSNALEEAITMLDTAVQIVRRNSEMLWEQWKAQKWEPKHIDFQDMDRELQQECPQFPLAVCQSALNWVFFWHHLR